MVRLRGFYLRRKILTENFNSCDEHCFYIKLNTAIIILVLSYIHEFIYTHIRVAGNFAEHTKESYRTRQSKNNSSRCSIFGNKGKIDSPSDFDEFGEEVIH